MKIFGFPIPWTKQTDLNTVTPIFPLLAIPSRFGTVFESFGGQWQQHMVLDSKNLLALSAVYACNSLISGDIAKLGIKLTKRSDAGIWQEQENPAFSPVLRKPNRYQTPMQFLQHWLLSKLIWGNTYVIKERDQRGVVDAMYILDPQRVQPKVAPDGEVFYSVNEDQLSGVGMAMTAPASEIIHDRGPCLFHPLVGVPPLYASATTGTQASRIQQNSATFFQNMSRPSGHLTAPGNIDDSTAKRLKQDFEMATSGVNLGRLFVSGSGLKFEQFTVPADQAQLIEQLQWTVEDVARAYLVPLYKISAQKDVRVDAAMKQEYYDTCLHPYIQAIEYLLDDGLGLKPDMRVRIDIDELLRMDPKSRFERYELGVKAGVLKPNEARAGEDLEPVSGGNTPYLQQQNFSLSALAKRDASADPFGKEPASPAPAAPATDENEEMAMLVQHIKEGLECRT